MKKSKSIIVILAIIVFIILMTGGCREMKTYTDTNGKFALLPHPEFAETFMFDDFHYASTDELESHGWIVRTKKGWPGIPGASWLKENVSFTRDTENPENRFLRMTSTIGPDKVSQTQICHRRKYLEGTYAARVRFTNNPYSPENDTIEIQPGLIEVVESFYTITPYEKPLDPAYSELDFEYLPFGGWNSPPRTIANTSWETTSIEPWIAKNESTGHKIDCDGWHTYVIHVGEGKVMYFMDGKILSIHRNPNYPTSHMSINFNLWFIKDKPIPEKTYTFIEEIDWVYHAQNVLIDPDNIAKQVFHLRAQQTGFHDNVPECDPPLDCTCDM